MELELGLELELELESDLQFNELTRTSQSCRNYTVPNYQSTPTTKGLNELDVACVTMSGEDFFEHYTKKIKWGDTRDIDDWEPRQQSLNSYDGTMRMVDAVVDKITDMWCDQLPIFDSGFNGHSEYDVKSGLGGELGKAKRVLLNMIENGVLCNVANLGMIYKWRRLLNKNFNPSDMPSFTYSDVNSHPFANYEEQCTFTLTRILDRLMVWVLDLERRHRHKSMTTNHHHHHHRRRRRRCGDDGMEKIGIPANCGGGGGGGGGFVLKIIDKKKEIDDGCVVGWL